MTGAVALACSVLAARSWSQPVEGERGKAQNPPNQPAPGPMAKTPNERLQEAIRIATMTPEQRAQMQREMEMKHLRHTLAQAGFAEPELAERLETFLVERMESRRPLRVTSTLLYLASGAGGGRAMPLSDAQLAALLQRLEEQTQAQKVSEARALEALDAQIRWKQRPRLKALLVQNGVIGESAWYARSSLFGSTPGVESEILRFWNANAKLPPGIELPAVQEMPEDVQPEPAA